MSRWICTVPRQYLASEASGVYMEKRTWLEHLIKTLNDLLDYNRPIGSSRFFQMEIEDWEASGKKSYAAVNHA